MSAPVIVRLVLRASLWAVLPLALAAAPAALAGQPTAYDPFFYGVPQQAAAATTPTVSSEPATSLKGNVFSYPYWGSPGHKWIWVETRDASGATLDTQTIETDATSYLIESVVAGSATVSTTYVDRGVSLSYEDLPLWEGQENHLNFDPGAVTWTSAKGGPLGAPPDLRIIVGGWSSAGSIVGESHASGASATGLAWSLPGSLRWALCYYHDNEVAVWTPDASSSPVVEATQLNPETIAFDQGAAARMVLLRPRWASGNPGTVMKVRLENWPASTHLQLTGMDASAYVTTWGGVTYDVSTSPVAATYSLRVPKTAKVGKLFMTTGSGTIAANAVPVSVSANFQTCTFKAEKSSIVRGATTRLRGRIPVWKFGADISGLGKPKTVTVWARTKPAADAPASWDPRSAGWRQVAAVRTDKYGRFATPLLSPRRSTSYVCRYPGDQMRHRAYTSVCRVTVR